MQSLKELVAILVLTAPAWWLSRGLLAPAMPAGSFRRRWAVWSTLTATAALAPSIWLYAAVALPLLLWLGRRDPHPAAVYVLLLYAVPNAVVDLPAILVNELFGVGHQRLLALGLLLPCWWRARRQRAVGAGLDPLERLLAALLALMVLLYLPYFSITHSMRRLLLLLLDVMLLFLTFRRTAGQPAQLRDMAACWVASALAMAAVAVFETQRSWLLYAGINERWGDTNVFAFLFRAGSLRAQAAAGHSLSAGIFLAVAGVLYLPLQRRAGKPLTRLAGALLLAAGLAATFARAAWLALPLAVLIYLLLDPRGIGRALGAACALCLGLLVLLLSPLGNVLIPYLPFVGEVDSANVDYRRQLFEVSLGLIRQNPWFGSPFVLEQMESLRQGQGIIDLVNGYLQLALFYGLSGLALFAGVLAWAGARGGAAWRAWRGVDGDTARLVAAWLAGLAAMTFYTATANIEPPLYVLAGALGGLGLGAVRRQPTMPAWVAEGVAR